MSNWGMHIVVTSKDATSDIAVKDKAFRQTKYLLSLAWLDYNWCEL